METHTILYIHGMGGGGDSRIPSILKEYFSSDTSLDIKVVVRTYSFDPEEGRRQIAEWVDELSPSLVIGESLGAVQALRITGVPHILVSPSLNAPLYLGYLAFLALIPGVTALLDRIYLPKEGDRQKLHFSFRILRKYRVHRKAALADSASQNAADRYFAFFGTRDHYRKSGIVSVRTWEKYFGNTYEMYPGTHFMEEEFIISLLIPEIYKSLNIK